MNYTSDISLQLFILFFIIISLIFAFIASISSLLYSNKENGKISKRIMSLPPTALCVVGWISTVLSLKETSCHVFSVDSWRLLQWLMDDASVASRRRDLCQAPLLHHPDASHCRCYCCYNSCCCCCYCCGCYCQERNE
jgi:hypothetical protein